MRAGIGRADEPRLAPMASKRRCCASSDVRLLMVSLSVQRIVQRALLIPAMDTMDLTDGNKRDDLAPVVRAKPERDPSSPAAHHRETHLPSAPVPLAPPRCQYATSPPESPGA